MNVYEAIKQMRALTANNIPFSITFVSMDSTRGTSNGKRHVSKCLLRTGMSAEYSDKSSSLIAYIDLKDNTNKFFYIPLLLAFNEIEIKA